VEHFISNGDTIPDLLSDTVRWKRVFFDYPQFTQVRRMKDQPLSLTTEIDTAALTLQFTERGGDTIPQSFTYSKLDDQLVLEGILNTDTLKIHLQQYSLDSMGLLNRGFHWVNEVPYNRYNYER
ncbi:MAG: hypothetical protein AAF840_07095, partial [Bacteroidota bacterium]